MLLSKLNDDDDHNDECFNCSVIMPNGIMYKKAQCIKHMQTHEYH